MPLLINSFYKIIIIKDNYVHGSFLMRIFLYDNEKNKTDHFKNSWHFEEEKSHIDFFKHVT